MSMKTKYPYHSEGGVPGDYFFIRYKRTRKLSLRKPQSVEACRKRVIYPIIISEEVRTSCEVRERVKESVRKTYERQEQTRKKKEYNQEKSEWRF
jgi:hypothetical protein